MESNQSDDNLSFHSLEEGLKLISIDVLDMTKKDEDLATLGSKSVAECTDSSPPRDYQFDIDILSNDYARGLGPLISKLPRELRD